MKTSEEPRPAGARPGIPQRTPPGPNDDYSGWMIFHTSGPVYLPELTADQIDLRDVLQSLGATPRWNGQTRTPVTILWHSLMVAAVTADRRRTRVLEALFHDAAEAYVGDLIRPLDEYSGEKVKDLRTRIQAACFEAAGLPARTTLSPSVKRADKLMLRYEIQASWGYRRTVSWHRPPTSAEIGTVQKALRIYGPPSGDPSAADTLRREFARLTRDLTTPAAPIRRSLDAGWPKAETA